MVSGTPIQTTQLIGCVLTRTLLGVASTDAMDVVEKTLFAANAANTKTIAIVVMGDRAHYKAKCVELEEIVGLCLKAFSLIPTDALRREIQWFPSEEALRAIERGRDAATRYSNDHWKGR